MKVDLDLKMYIINLRATTNKILKMGINKKSIMEIKWNQTKYSVNPKADILDTAKEKINKLEIRI